VAVRQQLIRRAWSITPFKENVKPFARSMRDSVWGPWNWSHTLRLCRILAFEFGHLRSAAANRSIDRNGNPVPWFTYPAIEYLQRLDLSSKSVFEYGSGNSTRYWAQRAASVVSVEHSAEFYELIAPTLPANCELSLKSPAAVYISALAETFAQRGGRGFDIIVIDGHSRVRCAEHAVDYLARGGIVILDNSDWFPDAAEILRGAGLIECSMSGFAPIADCASTTSFFFHPQFEPTQLSGPGRSIGSVPKPKFLKVP
jgi:hypothetical protein